jgi:hypothetical protein
LARTSRVDRALARFVVEKDAIAVGILDETFADADAAHVLLLELLDFQANVSGQRCDLFSIDPNEARRASAAIATLRALESQALLEPGLFVHGVFDPSDLLVYVVGCESRVRD